MRRRTPPKLEADEVAHAMADMSELMQPVLDAVVGYRAECLRRGFNETVSEMMAAAYHSTLLMMMAKPKAKP